MLSLFAQRFQRLARLFGFLDPQGSFVSTPGLIGAVQLLVRVSHATAGRFLAGKALGLLETLETRVTLCELKSFERILSGDGSQHPARGPRATVAPGARWT